MHAQSLSDGGVHALRRHMDGKIDHWDLARCDRHHASLLNSKAWTLNSDRHHVSLLPDHALLCDFFAHFQGDMIHCATPQFASSMSVRVLSG